MAVVTTVAHRLGPMHDDMWLATRFVLLLGAHRQSLSSAHSSLGPSLPARVP